MFSLFKSNSLILLSFLLLGFSVFAQNQQGFIDNDIESQVQEMMQRQRRMLDTLMKDRSQFDEYVKELFKRMENEGAFQMPRGNFRFDQSTLKTKWTESDDSRVLIVYTSSKDDKVNIDIKDGLITLSGSKTIKENLTGNTQASSYSTRTYNFQKSLSIPGDVDVESVKFKSQEGHLHIVFKKLNALNKKEIKPKRRPIQLPKKSRDKVI